MDRVAIESFRPHWDRIYRWGQTRFVQDISEAHYHSGWQSGSKRIAAGQFDAKSFHEYLGLNSSEYAGVVRAMWLNTNGQEEEYPRQTIDFYVCEKILTSMGEPHLVHTLYLTDGRSGCADPWQ